MFKIGDFAQIGRVSGRQLRHYDRLGLLQPVHTDEQTGYRYYSAGQLPRLNRILALKALGFSLEQIGRLLDQELSVEELRGMLAVRKADLEQSLAQHEFALRQVEARISQIESDGGLSDYDVVVKQVPAQPYISVRAQPVDMAEAVELLRLVVRECGRRLKSGVRDNYVVVAHTDFEDEVLDLEIGVTLTRPVNDIVSLPGSQDLVLRELEPEAQMACLVRNGPGYESHFAYGALGIWMEANGYSIDGRCREVFLEPPFSRGSGQDDVMEIQFPVRKSA